MCKENWQEFYYFFFEPSCVSIFSLLCKNPWILHGFDYYRVG